MRKILSYISYFILATATITGCSLINNHGYSTSSSCTTTTSVCSKAPCTTLTTWNQLQHQPLIELQKNTDPTTVGWAKLAEINKKYSRDTPQLVQELKSWRQAYPDHPGNQLIPQDKTLDAISATQPKHIALLLPLQGPQAKMGQAVRNGFMSAYYENHGKQNHAQQISFYDTSSTPDIRALYQKAIQDGADFIVGPLTKDKVQALAKSDIKVPTLALNYTDPGWLSSTPRNFYEFGLSPHDEVQQIAEKAYETGSKEALIIAPNTPAGQHLIQTLTTEWQHQGGRIVDTLLVDAQTNFSTAIPALLHINPTADRSLMKAHNDKNILAEQRRQDFNVIFLLTEANTARQITPLLRYYYAGNVPIYSTSIINSGLADLQNDVDLNGISFVDIPWLVRMSHDGSNSRLFAIGRDAYLLSENISRLTELPNFPIYGATGALNLTEQQQIYRHLPWTTIHDGHA